MVDQVSYTCPPSLDVDDTWPHLIGVLGPQLSTPMKKKCRLDGAVPPSRGSDYPGN